ncbi:MAG TPA: helix-turn-helix domain-containing protein [Patescibacteria group bacterium]|nr:helix-turn-helix domain-containing protein [Patescibacteria group bacterium]
MARPSKLTDAQWSEIAQRIAKGETMRKLAREFGVSPASISERVSKQAKHLKTAATQLFQAEQAVRALPVSEQHTVRSLSDMLLSISSNLASAAELGSATAQHLNTLARAQSRLIGKTDNPDENTAALKSVAMLTATANEAAKIGANLIAANKGALVPEDNKVPSGLGHFYGE